MSLDIVFSGTMSSVAIHRPGQQSGRPPSHIGRGHRVLGPHVRRGRPAHLSLFYELLGYTRAVDNPKHYTISREKHVQVDGKFADAVLGEFGPEGKRYIAAVEDKGLRTRLGRFVRTRLGSVCNAFVLPR